MIKQPISVVFDLDAKIGNSKLIAISHVEDKYNEVLEVNVRQNGAHIDLTGVTAIARMVLHAEKDYLISDNVPCTINNRGNILIPFDNAVVKIMQGTVKIEVSISRGEDDVLTLQFPLWVSVKGSILGGAEVTPKSEGTIPDLLKDAKAALENLGDYDNLDNKPQINGVTLSGDKTSDELGVAGWKIAAIDNCIENGVLYSTSINNQAALVLAKNITTDITQYAFCRDGRVMWRTRQAETPWQPAGEWSEWEEIGGSSEIASGVVNQNGTISFYDADGNLLFTTTGASVIGPQGDPGNDYVLTAQDKADIAGMVDISGKADKATTLAGYGITDAYTKTQTDTLLNAKESTANKVTAVNSSASDTQYPSAKAVFDFGADILDDVNEEISDTNADIADLKAYIGYIDGDILGLHADFENKVFTRLGAAVGLTAGQDFNAFPMYGQRRRVVVDSNGVIDETESPENITENDTNVDVMVYQPKFYYKVVPLKLEKQSGGLGYHIRKANYYISSTPHAGFKLHPLFYDANGNEVDYVLFSAYEASYMWRRQVNATDYINEIFHDGVDTDTTIDTTAVLKSLPGVKPISGQYKAMNKVNMENCALRKSSNWHLDTIKSVSANQLLVAVEYGTFNTQSAIGLGIVNNSNSNSNNCSSLTGSTSAETFNTASGMASETIYDDAGTETPFNTNGKVAVSYRGMENPWGNIWKHVNGINIWGDGTMNGGQVYIADNFNFNESSRSENYKSAGFTIANTSGYISAFGYGDEDYDWLFIPSETAGNSSIPVGDREFCTSNLSAYKIARYGGNWVLGNPAGAFCLDCNSSTGFNYLYIGGRLLYVPTATGFGPQGPAGSNYALTAADRQAIAQIAMNGLNGNGVAY